MTGRRGSEWDSDLHSSRVLAQLHASSALPEPKARARLWSRTNAAERFPGDTGGRSPTVARAVARAGRRSGPMAKVTGWEDGGAGLDGKSRPSSLCHQRSRPSAERQDPGAGPGSAELGLPPRQPCAEFPSETGLGPHKCEPVLEIHSQGVVTMSFEKADPTEHFFILPMPKIF